MMFSTTFTLLFASCGLATKALAGEFHSSSGAATGGSKNVSHAAKTGGTAWGGGSSSSGQLGHGMMQKGWTPNERSNSWAGTLR